MRRREFLTKGKLTLAGILGYSGFMGKQVWDAREHREDTVRTPGFTQRGVKSLLEKTVHGEPQDINVYLLAEEEPRSYESADSLNFDWDTVIDDAEEALSSLHPNVNPRMSYENLKPQQLADRTGKTVEEAEDYLQDIQQPSTLPGYCAMDISGMQEDLEPFDIEDESDVDVYVSDFGNLATIGAAATAYGEAYVDNSKLDNETMAAKALAHEVGHLYGLRDNYTPLLTGGEGLMGAEPEEKDIASDTERDFEQIMEDMGCCH